LRRRSVVVLSNANRQDSAAPEGLDYRVNRYRLEIERNQKVLNDRVAGRVFIVGDGSSIADISARLCLAAPHGYERRRERVRGVSGNQTLLAGTRSV
jgi:glutathione S-transferase